MSSFSKIGKRGVVRDDKRKVKRHMTAMYRILGEVKELAKELHESGIEITEDNVSDVVRNYNGSELAAMEKFLLLGNLQMLKREAESDNTK
jgi:predicted peroxiredoxin